MILFINSSSNSFVDDFYYIEINKNKALELSAIILPYLKKLEEYRNIHPFCVFPFDQAIVYNKNRKEVEVKDIKILINSSSFYFEILDKNNVLHKSESVYFSKLF